MSEPTPYILELFIPQCPPRLDNLFRLHFHARNKIVKSHHSLIHFHTLGKKPTSPLRKYQLTIIRYCSRLLDWDNVVSSYKSYVDGLVHASILKDDTYACSGPWNVTQVFRSKKEGESYTYIKVEGIQEPKQGKKQKSIEIKILEKKRENY